ncbi:MAG: hypothetical protein K6F61_02865 [Clostridiales bacterium]|nr:hypothetical protein [Clostridiales bacterium]
MRRRVDISPAPVLLCPVNQLFQNDFLRLVLTGITLRFPGDGHVINYIRDRNLYYVFDCVSWVGSGHKGYGLSFCWGKTLTEAAMKYAQKQNTRQMAAYTNPRGGDIPMIFSGNSSILPGNYCDGLTVLQETPEEGYTYTLIEADPVILHAIDIIRGVW